ncbi:MAG: TMEM165/GDT1 family protein [Candidatus Edwardsbacteria bacterium]
MNWKIFIASFAALFWAEFGDKTQLAVITMAGETKKWFSVFLGASLAMACVSLLGALFGQFLGKLIPANYLHYIAGGIFIVIGILAIMGKL